MSLPVHRCFPPVADERTRLLLVGSLPGKASLAQGRYYAHPQNQFWRLVSGIVETDVASLAYEARLEALLAAGIGLWDTVSAASRRSSLDADIRLVEATDLFGLAARLPSLKAIGFNGGTSARIGRRSLAGVDRLALVDLPSSSPAYTIPFNIKAEEWRKLRRFRV